MHPFFCHFFSKIENSNNVTRQDRSKASFASLSSIIKVEAFQIFPGYRKSIYRMVYYDYVIR